MTAPLPCQHLAAAARQYPGVWRAADAMRAARGRDLPDWPDWCYLPMAGWYSLVSARAGVDTLPLHLVGDVARLAALGAWRMGRGIYRFDPALYTALLDVPAVDLPADVLYRLPEWGVYIETPGLGIARLPLAGVFAHLEWDAGTGRHELRLLLDFFDRTGPVPLHLGHGTVAAALDAAAAEARRQIIYAGATARLDEAALPPGVVDDLAPLLALVLYLCSDTADFGPERPARSTPRRTRQGWQLFPAKRARVWDVR